MNDEQKYSRLDTAFAQFLTQRTSFNQPEKASFYALVAELSYQQAQGHSCIYVTEEQQILVKASALASEQTISPLVLEKNRLYLQRYWFYENRLAEQIRACLQYSDSECNINQQLSRYFVELIDETDWQREAAKKSLTHPFSVITGGPGTGKTTTVVKILALLQELAIKQQRPPLHIALAAPTGKAAMRLQESIGQNKQTLPCSESIKQSIPETVTTVHRLLGARPPSPYFKHNATNPLVYDLVMVDEASMIDLALMSKLFDALKPGSRVILLGDKDQLSSVESGAVLSDLTTALPSYTTELKKSYRFGGDIKTLALAVNAQKSDEAWAVLEREGDQVSLLKTDLIDAIVERYALFLSYVKDNADIHTIFAAFNQFQVLCSNRHGEHGVININEQVEHKLTQQGKIKITGQWYEGRPVMVTKNDTSMQLYNGDIGLYLYDKNAAKYVVFFLKADGSIKKLIPSRLPAHETVFAMTIHKSQGSEFDECLCVLPDKVNPVLTKELVYTAITRAKKKLILFCEQSVFRLALQQKVERTGGLLDKLTGKDAINKTAD